MSTSAPPRQWPWVLVALLGALLPVARIVFLGEVPMAHDIGLSDLIHSHGAYDLAIGEALRGGHPPLWLDGPFLGTNLAGQIEAAPLYPPRLVALALLPQWTAFGLVLGFHVAVGALGAYSLARALGASPPAAALVGLSFGASGFFVAHLKHPNMIASGVYLPWVFAAVHGVGRQPVRWFALGPLAVAGAWLGGHPQIAYYGLLAAGIVALWVHRAALWGLASSAAVVIVGTLLAGAQILVTGRYVAQTLRAQADWNFAKYSPIEWIDLFFLLEPTLRGDPYGDAYRALPNSDTLPWEAYGHVGVLAIPLAAIALLHEGARRRTALALVLAAVVLAAFALGPATPLYPLAWSAVPGMDLFRFPGRVLVILGLVLALLAGLGLDRLLVSTSLPPRWVAVAALAITAAQLTFAHRVWVRSDSAAIWTAPSPWIDAARADADGEPRVFTIGPLEPWMDTFYRHRGFADGLEPYRALAGLPIGNRGRDFGVSSPDGYSAMTHQRPAWFWITVNRWRIDGAPPSVRVDEGGRLSEAHRRRLAKAGVTHAIVPAGRAWAGDVVVDRAGHRLVRLSGARPPAAVYGTWRTAASFEEARVYAEEDDAVVVEGAPAAGAGPAEPIPVPVRRHGPNELRVDVRGASGMLVVAEGWDDGWRAAVDGLDAPVWVADGYQRAVSVPPGAREVVLRYWPAGLTAGLFVSGSGAILWAGLIAIVWHLRRRPE